ncbi:hypothetical protein ACJRO7_000561 [Eucalyptus globulus]|uniref:Uncharacterized protein n=1 Tax=Eucalyptus globulus TaxID=34317 RepID=A0ABD3LNZ8_EUCGL
MAGEPGRWGWCRFLMLCVLVLLPSLVLGDCKCDGGTGGGQNKREALKYKVGAIAAILLTSAVGVCILLLGKVVPPLRPEKDVFFLVKVFAARVILATGLIHILPDSFDSLTSPCLDQNPWGNFPFTGFVAPISYKTISGHGCRHRVADGGHLRDLYTRSHFSKAQPAASEGDKESDAAAINDDHARHLHVRTHATHGHAHGSAYQDQEPSRLELLRHRVVSQLGILVHSVMIGISLGTSGSTKTVKPLMAAFTFHQFFEGMGLGGCITQVNNKQFYLFMGLMRCFYDFMSAKVQGNGGLQLLCNCFLLFGAGCTTFLAKWA